jgi:hypothetical protein
MPPRAVCYGAQELRMLCASHEMRAHIVKFLAEAALSDSHAHGIHIYSPCANSQPVRAHCTQAQPVECCLLALRWLLVCTHRSHPHHGAGSVLLGCCGLLRAVHDVVAQLARGSHHPRLSHVLGWQRKHHRHLA